MAERRSRGATDRELMRERAVHVDWRQQSLVLRMRVGSSSRTCVRARRTPLIGRRMSGGPEERHCVRLQPDAASAVDAQGKTLR
jgi:hypothetical protein